MKGLGGLLSHGDFSKETENCAARKQEELIASGLSVVGLKGFNPQKWRMIEALFQFELASKKLKEFYCSEDLQYLKGALEQKVLVTVRDLYEPLIHAVEIRKALKESASKPL